MPPVDPLLYRLYEIVLVYGQPLKVSFCYTELSMTRLLTVKCLHSPGRHS
jgi:hypothetical protein